MASVDPNAARFPGVAQKAGHYESFYLKLCHPGEPLGAWLRYTVHKRPGGAPTRSLWFTLFEPGGPRAAKVTAAAPRTGDGDWLSVGEARLGPGRAEGSIAGQVEWNLRFESGEPPLLHLPRHWMYSARLPRTKLLSPLPGARFDGTLLVDGREVVVDGWRGMVGHNWGAQHAERWIWLHGLTEDGDWLDAALGRVKLGPVTTPWIANGALSVAGERHVLGGPARRVEVDESPDSCAFLLPGKGMRVRGTVSAPRERFVGWVYADPDGGEHHTVNCSIADMRLAVERSGGGASWELEVRGGAAYELGMREHDHGMRIQPFPDGA
ncbi:MAG TPA: hypothetical protein VHJ37_07625 [Thermoleophilaceae bacterium]|nr:hypothetical protein [Thermoleophilaceae bacterium]